MAVITGKVSQTLANELKKVVDFYYWKSLLCARRMPIEVNQPGTVAQQATWNAVKARNTASRTQQQGDKLAYARLCVGSDRTWFDQFSHEFMKQYAIHGSASMYISHGSLVVSGGRWKISAKKYGRGTLAVRAWIGKVSDKPVLFRWVPERLENVPPNLTERRKLEVLMPLFPQTLCFSPVGQWCQWLGSAQHGTVCYAIVVDSELTDPPFLYRSGVYRLEY